MNQETINLLAHKAEVKIDKLNESKLKYLVLSMFAGMFVGLGCILIFTIGGQLHAVHSPATKIVAGASYFFHWKPTFVSTSLIFVVAATIEHVLDTPLGWSVVSTSFGWVKVTSFVSL